MPHTTHPWYTILGLVQSGDIADTTTYTTRRRRRAVLFKKTWPKVPPTPAQQQWQTTWAQAMARWRELTPAQRQAWETAARRLSLCLTGLNTFMHFRLHPNQQAQDTIARQAKVTLTI